MDRHEEHRLVEPDVIAGPIENDGLQVVVEDRARDPAERGERLDVPAHQALERLVERESGEHRARVASG
jgi:hypothetical protein